MKILILGSNGMLGSTLYKYFKYKKNIHVLGTSRNSKIIRGQDKNIILKFEIDFLRSLETKIRKISPNVIINCIGIVKSEVSKHKSTYVYKINSKLPKFLNDISTKNNFKLIHISTDCVFSGLRKNYSEKHKPDPKDLYGKSKLNGEFSSTKNLVIRTSIIGHELNNKRGLLEWFLKQKKEVYGYENAYFSGLTTYELSKIIYNKILFNKKIFGLYHISGNKISKYRLLQKIKKIYKLNLKLNKENNFIIDRSLDCSKFIKKTGYKKVDWNKMIKENKIFFQK